MDEEASVLVVELIFNISLNLISSRNHRSFRASWSVAQVASLEIAELIAVNLKPHNLAEEIILPACRKIVKTMIGGSADIDICKIPLSNDTIHRRIKDMSENIEQNTAKTLVNSNFALHVDETTDITSNAQLIAFVRFIHENDIINQFLCCRELPDFTTGKHIFQVISSYLEEIKVSWKLCIGICTDCAPAMTGHLKGFVAHVKELNEDILVTHCFLHREALVTKFLPSDLKIVLEQCVKMVNYIKSRPLKSRLFSKLCQDMEAKYESLLLHTEVRWLSRGKVIPRVLKLKDEMKIIFYCNKRRDKSEYKQRKDRAPATIYYGIDEQYRTFISSTTSSSKAWIILKEQFEPVSRASVIRLLDEFFSIKFNPDTESIAVFITRIRKIVERLKGVGHPFNDMYCAFQAIRTLSPEFQDIVQILYRWPDEEF
ncbi:SCAN domain-containing protein 3 [Trichonephila clavipes]|nr:SCAN domain-containing protein 3 [Trichonephila clavipes]